MLHQLSNKTTFISGLDALVGKVQSDAMRKEVSAYEHHQAQKLDADRMRVLKYDTRVEEDLFKWFVTSGKMRGYEFEGKSVLCVGARLGAEVRVFIRLGALAIGYDFNPGPRNPWVVYGTGAPMQWGSRLFDYVYTNILDHIVPRMPFFHEVERTLKTGGIFITHVDQNRPDNYSVVDNRGAAAALQLMQDLHTASFDCTISKKKRMLHTHPAGTVQYICRKQQ